MTAEENQAMGNLEFKELDVTKRIGKGKYTDTRSKQEAKVWNLFFIVLKYF